MNMKLTAEAAKDIYTSSETAPVLAAKYGISRWYVQHIKGGYFWGHVTFDLERGAAKRGRPRKAAA